jgi:uncharacterized membrane protein YsdA (DUF1294 family)/cold shock CspA family protein
MRFEGKLKSWNDERGFGFIESMDGGQEIFVHIKAFTHRPGRPQAGQLLSFEVELGPQGKKRAHRVEPARVAARAPVNTRSGGRVRRQFEGPAPWGIAARSAIPAFALLCAVVGFAWHPPLMWVWVYVGASLVTFFAYVFDKSAAARGAWRTAESTLHLLALVGGWPGALLAQQILRHKTAKAEFRAVFWATVVINVAAFVFLSSPAGRRMLPSI